MRAASSYHGSLGPFQMCSQALWVTLLCGQYLIPSHLWPWLVSLCLLGWHICMSCLEKYLLRFSAHFYLFVIGVYELSTIFGN